ncbi:hypothetical protein ACEPAI_2225 [Sanghuangporus weigelae]
MSSEFTNSQSDAFDDFESLVARAKSSWDRYVQSETREDLDATIALEEAVVDSYPHGHPERLVCLRDLAYSFWTRFERWEDQSDLDRTIEFERDILTLCPEGHLDRHYSLHELSASLDSRFNHSGKVEDLEESIKLGRAALDLRPDGHPDRHHSLSNLSASLDSRFNHGGKVEDLEESIKLVRAVLDLRPDDHPRSLHNLSASLNSRFNHIGEVEDLEESIKLDRATLDLRPEGHPLHSSSLSSLSYSLYARFQRHASSKDLEESIQCLRRAAVHVPSSSLDRLEAVQRWTSLARSHDHVTTLDAYRIAMSLVQRVLTFSPTVSEQHRFLSQHNGYQSLALDAASYAIEKGDFAEAVGLVEQGRALLWSQMRGFRTTLDGLAGVDSSLAQRFKDCGSRQEALITSKMHAHGPGMDETGMDMIGALQVQRNMDGMLVQARQLSEEQEALIKEIRQIRGFENFLGPVSFGTLQAAAAAAEGPVIVLNYSEFRCDALIILSREDTPCTCVQLDADFYRDAEYMHKRLIEGRKRDGVDSDAYDEILREVMKFIWDRAASKVVEKLKELGIKKRSRIWWCPTSVLSTLPFHAAGPYEGANGDPKYLLDNYISSYTPTLVSLIDARSRSGMQNGNQRLLVVCDTQLKSARKECETICKIRRKKNDNRQLFDAEASCESVMNALRDVEWVHFAYHGSLDPFQSSFKLFDGGLTLLDIIRANLPNAEFAFLSACHTAEQSPNAALDEVLYLSAAMQFCGFRSVIGTMWEFLDRDGPQLSERIYKYLSGDLQEGEIRFKRAAAAVRKAAVNLKQQREEGPDGMFVDIRAERWVNLVHIGA